MGARNRNKIIDILTSMDLMEIRQGRVQLFADFKYTVLQLVSFPEQTFETGLRGKTESQIVASAERQPCIGATFVHYVERSGELHGYTQ